MGEDVIAFMVVFMWSAGSPKEEMPLLTTLISIMSPLASEFNQIYQTLAFDSQGS